MLQMGTAAMAARWHDVAYAAATSDGLPRLPRTARLEPSELTPILKMARAAIEAKLARLRAKETAPPGEGGGEADEADEEDEDGRPTGKRKRKAGGGAGVYSLPLQTHWQLKTPEWGPRRHPRDHGR